MEYCAIPERASRIGTHAFGLSCNGSVATHSKKRAMVTLSVTYEQVITWKSLGHPEESANSA